MAFPQTVTHDELFVRGVKDALRMARAYASNRRMRVVYQERAADYRECLVDQMRRRQGWTLAELVARRRIAS